MQDAVAPLAPSTPLAASTAMNAQWHWTTHIRLPSIRFNRLSVRKTCYPPLTSPTHLKAYTDASFVQLRAAISMDKKQIAFTKSEHDSMPDTLSRLATATLSTTTTFAMLRQRNSHFFRLTKSEQKNLMSRKTPKKNSTGEQVLSTVLSPHSDQSQQADPIH